MKKQDNPLQSLMHYPLMHAIFGRRSRRFGLGMEIPSGPLAFKSESDPVPLSKQEQMILIAAATGVSGWNFGVPFGPGKPDSQAEFTLRFTGRTAPTAAGIGTPAIFYTDDEGSYVTRTRDAPPERMQELSQNDDDLERILAVCSEQTVRIKEGRLDLPAEPPHMLPPNLWMANAPGSTLFMPIGDVSEQFLGILALAVSNGVMVIDHETGQPAGNLAPFVRSGLLNEAKQLLLADLQADTYETNCLELAFMGHNIVLTMQAMGLGGLYFNGLEPLSILGAFAGDGIKGLGFRFVEDERWTAPNPVGLDGVYEALCPPYYPDMHAAVQVFADRKFGEGGAYNPETPGPWKESAEIKGSVAAYTRDFIDCMSEVAQYIYDKHGKFPGTRTTMVMPGFVQAVHIDTKYYDTYFKPGAYLNTHAEHMKKWHNGNS
jgi:hypothetical protein